jgi:hypothetical protein
MLNDEIWLKLQSDPASADGVTVRRLRPGSARNLFAAFDARTGARFLTVKSNDPRVRPSSQLPAGRGFQLHFLHVPSDSDGAYCLRFQLTDAAQQDVFNVVGNDVVESAAAVATDVDAFRAFIARIEEWQAFLDALPKSGLGDEAQQGLFAELWFLRSFLLKELPAGSAVRAWSGPSRMAKDFHLPHLAIEVKATSTKQPVRFSISSEIQLDSPNASRLVLFGLVVERLGGGGLSLPDLVTLIRADLASDASTAALFSRRLLESGYRDVQAETYAVRFAVRSENSFDVRDGFPRITPADIRAGIADLRYSILKSECDRFLISDTDMRTFIRNAQ